MLTFLTIFISLLLHLTGRDFYLLSYSFINDDGADTDENDNRQHLQ